MKILPRLSTPIPLIVRIPIFLVAFCFSKYCPAQCVATSAHSSTIMSNDNTIGNLGFSNPTNIASSDNVRASAAAIASLLNGDTYYLKATGFNFSIPSYASICGVVVEIESRAGGLGIGAWIQDNQIRLVKNGIVAGDNKANLGVDWSGSESYHSYGGATDLWGTSLTYADVSSANFGVAISAKFNGLALVLPSAQIDHVRITIYYNPALPTRLISFSAVNRNNSAFIQWQTADEEDDEYIALQRSQGNSSWENLSRFDMKSGQNGKLYTYQDKPGASGNYKYRLEITNANGYRFYSETKSLHIEDKNILTVYPNPSSDYLYITNSIWSDQVIVSGLDLKTIRLPIEQYGRNRVRVDIRALRKGMYFITVNNHSLRFIKQ